MAKSVFETEEGQIFESVVIGSNFMTPDVIGFIRSGNYVCELSKEIGSSPVNMHGVTVVNTVTMKKDEEKCTCFTGHNAEQRARDYIRNIGLGLYD